MIRAIAPLLALAVIGAAWGATQPFAKIAVSEGARPLGILIWQNLIVAGVLGALVLIRGKRLPWTAAHLRLYLVIALIGSLLPGMASYSAAVHLPSGVLSILLSTVPMLAFPIALLLGLEGFRARRLLGLSLGMIGVSLLILPEQGLPASVAPIWVGVALISSGFYAMEGNYVAKWGTEGLDAMQVLTGASLVGLVLTVPLALVSGQGFVLAAGGWTAPDIAIVASSVLHAGAYSGYVWLVGFAGPVFAVQVSYLVTVFGVGWAMLFLGEGYSGWFWAALASLLMGMALVQPRRKTLADDRQRGNTAV
ncbi:DMT family transporter [Cognatishimia sp. F0-27]|uniref:DMT family transporter n=1 Tax=Cognatishimia sp. F0-27 TaxID=2816855 RepID=UPI001D0CC665|nr:DMT family transporter [Cognatishimia sp. F0-27]MCC1494109.1 DMT family transporter [Cognatishimia sp. F0-27]